MKDWNGIRILMIGGARQGLAAARFLARAGALVTINDQRPAEQMEAARAVHVRPAHPVGAGRTPAQPAG